MLRERALPLFAGFFGLMAVGIALRRARGLPVTPDALAAALTYVVVDVTAPLLVLDVLLRARIPMALLVTLAAPTAALFAMVALGATAARALGLSRPATGALVLCVAFSNTGFMGIPIAQGLYPDAPATAQAAVLIDTFDTTLLLWTLGAALAARYAGRPTERLTTTLRAMLRRPIVWAVIAGVALNAAGVALPWWLRPGIERTGAATGPLVFLVLGLNLDVAKARQRPGAVGVGVALKLVVAPALALAVAWTLGLRGPVAWAGVLQSAMPSALVATLIAAQAGCDGALASAICATGMLLAPVSVALWVEVAARVLG